MGSVTRCYTDVIHLQSLYLACREEDLVILTDANIEDLNGKLNQFYKLDIHI